MILNERQTDILNELKNKKRVTVSSIAKQFFVSEMTVRRDLKLMEEGGLIQRYHGGAIINNNEYTLPISLRKLLHAEQKAELAKKAQRFLHDSMNIFIDSSSTSMYIIPLLSEYKNIHIITNSIQNLIVASEHNIQSTIVGGDYYKRDMCTVGSITEKFLKDINVDIAFFSSLGLSDNGLITDCDEPQNFVRKIVMENCENNIFIFDNHKLHKKYLYTLCSIHDITELIIL